MNGWMYGNQTANLYSTSSRETYQRQSVCMYVSLYICIYVGMHICKYVCMHVSMWPKVLYKCTNALEQNQMIKPPMEMYLTWWFGPSRPLVLDHLTADAGAPVTKH